MDRENVSSFEVVLGTTFFVIFYLVIVRNFVQFVSQSNTLSRFFLPNQQFIFYVGHAEEVGINISSHLIFNIMLARQRYMDKQHFLGGGQ